MSGFTPGGNPKATKLRTDDNNNPTAFTTAVAEQAGLIRGVDYEDGSPFPAPSPLITAKLLGDPIDLTIRVINNIGFTTRLGGQRWPYIWMPNQLWGSLTRNQKSFIIGHMYKQEGGAKLEGLFPPSWPMEGFHV